MRYEAPLPIEGYCEVGLPVERMWEHFTDVSRWPEWNPCFWRARVIGGELRLGARLVWVFNSIERRYPYKMPATAGIVEFDRCERVTWEVRFPGFHALHRYRFEPLGPESCRFGSWEVAEGAVYRGTRRFWLAHFRYVCRSSLAGAQRLPAG